MGIEKIMESDDDEEMFNGHHSIGTNAKNIMMNIDKDTKPESESDDDDENVLNAHESIDTGTRVDEDEGYKQFLALMNVQDSS